jgi:dephospho-CoA kinase
LIIPDLHAMPGPTVIGISGRIYAGKTTAARLLEGIGFAYTRFRLVIDDEITVRGELPSRGTRQKLGLEINRTKGQRWLCEQVLGRVRDQTLIVVDGLRFRQDHAFLTERYGSRFLHLHMVAGTDLRRERYDREPMGHSSFDQSDGDPVEREVDDLARLAGATIDNSSTIGDLKSAVFEMVQGLDSRCSVACRYQLS